MYGASSSIVVSMLTPFARRVISRIRRLNRSKAFGAITRLTSGPAVKLNPRNAVAHPFLRSCHRTLRLIYLELELLRDELRDAFHHPLPRPLAANVDITWIMHTTSLRSIWLARLMSLVFE